MASFDSPLSSPAALDTGSQLVDEKPAVDPFLVELLENPRYRLIGNFFVCYLFRFWIEQVQLVVSVRITDLLSFSD